MSKRKIAYEINQFYRVLGTECPKYKNIKVTANELEDEFILSEVLYDLEDNVYVYEGAAELSHKLQHIKKTHRAVKTIGITLMLIGFILAFGTAGASDLNTISFTQIIVQLAISLSVLALGLVIINKTED